MGKLLVEKDIEAVVQPLYRLTQAEARVTAAQTLEVVYGLVRHRRNIMDGEDSTHPVLPSLHAERFLSSDTDGSETAASILRALGVFIGGLRQQADRISHWV